MYLPTLKNYSIEWLQVSVPYSKKMGYVYKIIYQKTKTHQFAKKKTGCNLQPTRVKCINLAPKLGLCLWVLSNPKFRGAANWFPPESLGFEEKSTPKTINGFLEIRFF